MTFRFKIGDAVVVKQIRNIGWSNSVYGNLYNLRFVIDIGTDDIANGRVISWDSLKNLKVEIYQYSTSYENKLHYNQYYETSSDVSGYTFTRPSLEIQAIGDAAIQNATVVAGNSMVHFQGYSDTFTTTSGVHYVTGYEDAPTSGTFTTGLPLLKNFGNAMNTSTGIFTAPHTGLYSINVVVHKNNNSTSGKVSLVIDNKETAFGDIKENYDNSGASSVYHIDSGKQVYLKSITSDTPTAVNLSITALQDRVPQAISARPGMTLETLTGVCDGRSVSVSSGTYTMPTGTKMTITSESVTDVTGTSISYKPPPGTKQVVYSMLIHSGAIATGHSQPIMNFFVYLDGNKIDRSHMTYRPGDAWSQGWFNVQFVFDIDSVSSNDYSTGKLVSWDSHKIIKVMGREAASGSYGMELNSMHNAAVGSGTYAHTIVYPQMEITAIGDGPGIVPSTGMNVVKVSTGTTASYTPPKSSPGVEIEELKISIKPTATDSVISLQWDVFCDGYRNLGFRVTRNITGTDVLVYDDSKGVTGSFLAMVPYDETGTTSTQTSPQTAQISWHDEPNTTSEVTYKLWVGNSWNTNEGFTLNKCMRTVDSDGREYGVSSVIAIEYPKTARPLDTENALTIPPFVGATNKEKLYNQSGDLYFNGKQLSNEWYKNGGDLYRFGGNVGIGKSSPAYKLDVTGDINFTNSLRKNGTALGDWNASGSNVYRSTGNVGIGTTSPSFPLHINTHASGTTASSEKAYWYSGITTTSAGGSYSVSLRTSHVIWCGTGVIVSSDQRIKTNIREVPDNLSLQKLRDISCCYYDYKDKVNRGSSSTIGFIAQQVKEHMPMAVSIQTDIIPSVYKVISCEWTGNVMYSQELGTVSGVKYKFYVSNTNDNEVEKIVTGSSDNTFTFEQQWNKVFCYGREVDDLHTLDKNKLFALNFSATQELDRQQQVDKAKITSLETEVASLKTTLASQQTLIQSLMTRLEALENP